MVQASWQVFINLHATTMKFREDDDLSFRPRNELELSCSCVVSSIDLLSNSVWCWRKGIKLHCFTTALEALATKHTHHLSSSSLSIPNDFCFLFSRVSFRTSMSLIDRVPPLPLHLTQNDLVLS